MNVRIRNVLFVWMMGAGSALAATVPFTEEFQMDAANWYDGAGSSELPWAPSGGPDGSGHVFAALSLVAASEGDTPVLFRAQDKWGSSGGAFEGDWIADSVLRFSCLVRHDAPFPLTFFVRFSSPANFPGAIAVNFAPVLPESWTRIDIDIDPANPQFVSFEGSDFTTVFSNVGHIQIGVSVGPGQDGFPAPITARLDKVNITDCLPDCAGRECGDDGCGGACGQCGEGLECDAAGICQVAPIPTVSTWGLIILGLCLAVIARIQFGRAPSRGTAQA